ncbi:hypothetical protein CLV52_2924 [Amnibacterium kyonggiense]|uniref:Uncharacterized protein n=2 Tax=Amnibacterium kyonggiense TaxID=595671 RepID=A0A4R7FGJ5_9MICO|nr:hypothetical protein CLV52_2924 [Amnibacterium kyonggiense]
MPSDRAIAPTVTVHGRVIPYDDLESWTQASVPSRDATRLSVFAIGSDTGGSPCGSPVVRVLAEESATTVRISVAAYQEPRGADLACTAIGHAPVPQPVVLRAPIGDRRIVDASTGKARALLVASDHPQLVAPAGFVAQPFGGIAGQPTVTQTWRAEDGRALALRTTTPAAVREDAAYGRIVRRSTIDGAPATVYSTGGGSARWQVQWTPNGRQTITLLADDSLRQHWTADAVEALARAVTNYRTEGTGRLPLPETPGMTVASWSSADGPVRHAPNLWKSSGIWVGVRCEGVGTVTVSLRNTSRTFFCTERATDHLERSDGAPDETFFVDVRATKGVRWTVALARASLDGS